MKYTEKDGKLYACEIKEIFAKFIKHENNRTIKQ